MIKEKVRTILRVEGVVTLPRKITVFISSREKKSMMLRVCIVGTIRMQFFAKTSDKLNLKWCQIRLRGRGLMSPMWSTTAEEDVLFVIALCHKFMF